MWSKVKIVAFGSMFVLLILTLLYLPTQFHSIEHVVLMFTVISLIILFYPEPKEEPDIFETVETIWDLNELEKLKNKDEGGMRLWKKA